MATGIGGITDVTQSTDEIVQSLRNYGFIYTIEDSEDIRLSMAGLAEAERVC
jgi:aspartate/tyrosine/aromatic aminotransferase